MKDRLILVFSLLLTWGLSIQSQIIEPKEDAIIQIRYNKTVTEDTLKGKQHDSPMILRVGKTASMFYPEKRMFTDSVESRPDYGGELLTLEDTKKYGVKAAIRVFGRESEYLFRNVHDNETMVCQQIATYHVGYSEKTELPQWTVHTDSLTNILGYDCIYATCDFRGRIWEAWFTPEIPINEGPWKLAGLPGLVLKAQDIKRQYIFEAESIRTEGLLPVGIYIYIYARRPIEMYKDRQGYLRAVYELWLKKKFMNEVALHLGFVSSNSDYVPKYDLEETDFPHQ